MKTQTLGGLFDVSIASLGGGGIGQIWGETDTDEVLATIHAALDAGITMFDVAPLYGCAEDVVGRAFANGYPDDVKVSTKCMLGNAPSGEVLERLMTSLDESCERLKRPFIDVFFLHGYIIADGWNGGSRADLLDRIAMPWSLYQDAIVPALETLIAKGRIGAWGITSSPAEMTCKALAAEHKPDALQAVTNALNSSGGMNITGSAEDPKALASKAKDVGVGVMGVRAVAAGALTNRFDRHVDPDSPEARDYERAANFRSLAKEFGVAPEELAYRYTLSLPEVETVVLGIKNRAELNSFLFAESAKRLTASEIAEIERATQ